MTLQIAQDIPGPSKPGGLGDTPYMLFIDTPTLQITLSPMAHGVFHGDVLFSVE